MKNHRLSERAMLVHFASHGWTGRKLDPNLAHATARDQAAEDDAIEVFVRLAPPKALSAVNAARNAAYTIFTDATLPWMHGGLGILPCVNFMDFQERMRKALANYYKAVEDLLREWPQISAASRTKRLGKLAQRHQIPTAGELRHRFDVKVDIYPVPDIADWRVKVGDEEAAEIRQEVQNNIEALTTQAMQKVWSRLSEFIATISKTMKVKDKKFRDNMFENLRDFCESLPNFNLTNDPELEKVRAEALKLCRVDTEELREIPNSRKKFAESADEVLAKISQYLPK